MVLSLGMTAGFTGSKMDTLRVLFGLLGDRSETGGGVCAFVHETELVEYIFLLRVNLMTERES
jgi:hypothetical protein